MAHALRPSMAVITANRFLRMLTAATRGEKHSRTTLQMMVPWKRGWSGEICQDRIGAASGSAS